MGGFSQDLWDNIYSSVFSDLNDAVDILTHKPLLAHYTSMRVLECILRTNEIWFSNPLFMNDLEEVRFGVLNGVQEIKDNPDIIKALGDKSRHNIFVHCLFHYMSEFEKNHLFDTYVFCLSEHDPEDRDGLLSMWRGYGELGKGAALVFDTSKIATRADTPLIFAPVHYGSTMERFQWFDSLGSRVAKIISESDIPDDRIYLASGAVFERLKVMALFSKHAGFREEREWRIVYMKDRDESDMLKQMQDYFIGPRGVEPKLRFKVEPIEGVTSSDLSLEKIIHSIILGPSVSSQLTMRSVHRMLELIGKAELGNRMFASTIPLRGA